jgi:glutamate-ammonia-ligase adenylyltransferase
LENPGIDKIRASSQYLAALLRRPEYEDWLIRQNNLKRRYALTALYRDLEKASASAGSFEDLLRVFREFKQRHFLRIGGRELLGLSDLRESVAQVSDLASVSLQVGLERLSARPDWCGLGENRELWDRVGRDVRICVMGLGKLGGGELNYVSDVDLMFLYSAAGAAEEAGPQVQAPLGRICLRLTRLLSDHLEGDRVFNVDLRLRPGGKDGVLTPSAAGAAEHYLHRGAAWERQVLLKARPVAGDRAVGREFLSDVRPFIFRRFLDFQALDELRAMRDRILREAPRPRPGFDRFDVKLGIGGIREVEFLVQSLQLIYGGRFPELDDPSTLSCLEKLKSLKLLPAGDVKELSEAYIFLRRVEHWIQLDSNRQTQKLPKSPDALGRLAFALGFEGGMESFLEGLDARLKVVHRHFTELFHFEEAPGAAAETAEAPDSSDEAERLARAAPEAAGRLEEQLNHFSTAVGAVVYEALAPLADAGDPGIPEKALTNVERYLGRVRRRPGLVKLLQPAPDWLPGLVRALAAAEMVADLLYHQPSLVEGIATAEGECPGADTWEDHASGVLSGQTNYEEALEWIRRLKNERILQLALADLAGGLAPETVETDLSRLAEFVLQQTLKWVQRAVGLEEDLPLAIVGMGKLGSREMGYLSDLDLVFVYRPPEGEPADQIPTPVIRMTQRFMRMLSVPLAEGPGYEVDARLRPTGTRGPLAVTLDSWLDYYGNKADFWELQALLRARGVAGDAELCRLVDRKAEEIACRERDASAVWERLCHLRSRMEQERTSESREQADLKLGPGGLADFEFMVQGLLLTAGHRYPELYTRSVRLVLERDLSAAAGFDLPTRELRADFSVLRSLEHRLHLHIGRSGARLTPGRMETLGTFGIRPAAALSAGVESFADVKRVKRRVRDVFRKFCPGTGVRSSGI